MHKILLLSLLYALNKKNYPPARFVFWGYSSFMHKIKKQKKGSYTMGYWNESCMLTHLITQGEEVYGCLLVKAPTLNVRCYPTCDYTPLLMLSGIYDDYGMIEKINEDDMPSLWLEGLKTMRFIDTHSKTLIDLSSTEKISNFLLMVRDGDILMQNPTSGERELQVEIVFIKKKVLDELFLSFITEYHSINQFIENDIAEYINSKEIAKKAATLNSLGSIPLNKQIRFSQTYSLHSFLKLTHEGTTAGYSSTMFETVEDVDCECLYSMIRRMAQTNEILHLLRKAWHRPSGKGSRNEYEILMQTLSDLTADELKRQKNNS